MRLLALAPKWNTPGRHDATGAFQPEAKRFCAYHEHGNEVGYVLIDNHASKAGMREQVLTAIAALPFGFTDLGLAFFCHGTKTSIQFGFDTKHIESLASAIAKRNAGTDPIVTFYSCDVARDADRDRTDDRETLGGDGGFADEMRDALCDKGMCWCVVDGHSTVGHTTRNPYVRRFQGNGHIAGGTGGFYIVPPGSKRWSKWREKLRGDLRFEYPYLDVTQIYDILDAPTKPSKSK